MKPSKFETIQGWFDPEDQRVYDMAVDRASNGDVLVEVGVWMGRSACYMAEAIKASGKALQFFAVDVWKVFDYEKALIDRLASMGNPDLYRLFLDNVDKADVAEFVIPLHLESTRAARIFREKSVSFVYIDAAHGYESNSADIDAWLPKIKPGGIIAGHDYNREGVWKAVNERFGDRVERSGISWFVKW